jgi:hypothetical protein
MGGKNISKALKKLVPERPAQLGAKRYRCTGTPHTRMGGKVQMYRNAPYHNGRKSTDVPKRPVPEWAKRYTCTETPHIYWAEKYMEMKGILWDI